MDLRIIQTLQDIVGAEHVTTERADRICYSYDATQQKFLPDVVVYPADARQISLVLKMANAEGIPVFPRGAGSGFTGGSLPTKGGIVLVTTRLDRILKIDEENLVAEVEPGVVTEQFQLAVEKVGLFYPPDPASLKFSTLGGNVAECAGGPRCVKYGVTKDYILGLEVVTPQGDIIRTGGQTMKGVVGYDLTKLMVGSEGTLGVITRIIIKLLPLPEAKKTMLVLFDSIDGAARAVSAIIGGKIIPTTLEFMDATTIECVRKATAIEIPPEARAVLIIEVDGDRDLIERQAQRIARDRRPPRGSGDAHRRRRRRERGHLESAALRLPQPAQRQPRQVQRGHLRPPQPGPRNDPGAWRRSRETRHPHRQFRPCRRRQHPRQHHDRPQRSEGELEKAEKAIEEIFAAALELGGTMSGEHGIGITKAPYIPMELDPAAVAYMKTIKRPSTPTTSSIPGRFFWKTEAGIRNRVSGTQV